MISTLHGRSNKRWRICPHDAARVGRLEQLAGVPPIVAQLLLARGVYEPEAARTFLDAKLTGLRDPDELPGVPDAADRIHAAIKDRRKIVVYGDYDADGMTSTAILLSCLRLLGADATYFVPNRLEEGYGLACESLKSLAERGASLVISVDCGITSIQPARTARDLGLELIVTDHHEFGPELPAAAAIVHPRLPGSSYPFGGLCGAGVALKLAWAICQRASQAKRVTEPLRNFLMSAVGLAAIGTVAGNGRHLSAARDEHRWPRRQRCRPPWKFAVGIRFGRFHQDYSPDTLPFENCDDIAKCIAQFLG
jgi:single-stranded-DNA-specific exonuclease